MFYCKYNIGCCFPMVMWREGSFQSPGLQRGAPSAVHSWNLDFWINAASHVSLLGDGWNVHSFFTFCLCSWIKHDKLKGAMVNRPLWKTWPQTCQVRWRRLRSLSLVSHLQKEITPASDPKQCVGGQQQKIRYTSLRQPPNMRHRDKSQEHCLQDICLCLLYTSYLKILCRNHVSDSCRSVHQWGSATRSTSSDSCLNIFVSQAPLQDPCLWIHVSASMCISGSSARSMLPDS